MEINLKSQIINPLKIQRYYKVTEHEIELLKQWIKVCSSASRSVHDSIDDPTLIEIEFLMSIPPGSLAEDTVTDVVLKIFEPSGDYAKVDFNTFFSITDSVRDIVFAYISSFFKIETWDGVDHEAGINPFQCGVDLWNAGLVASFDGKKWRLHAGSKADIVYEIVV